MIHDIKEQKSQAIEAVQDAEKFLCIALNYTKKTSKVFMDGDMNEVHRLLYTLAIHDKNFRQTLEDAASDIAFWEYQNERKAQGTPA